MRNRFFLFMAIGLAFTASILWTNPAAAQLKVTGTRGSYNPTPIAITEFVGSSQYASDIRNIVEHDLVSSGLFKSISPRAFLERPTSAAQVPQFLSWKQIGAQGVVIASINDEGSTVTAEMRLWDPLSGKQLAGRTFKISKRSWRRIGHNIADAIYSRVTGDEGYFDSRIVYISESGNPKRPTKKLAMMDQDGANHLFLTSGKALVLTPRFDPNSQRIIYMAYYDNKPNVYLYNIETGREDLLGKFPGMSFAPRFSPDGRKAIYSVAVNGNSDIWEMDLSSRKQRRITNDPGIDTSPSYSPDMKRITFNSDRGGSQQLYVMDASGGNVKRISFGKGNYGTPVWSPRGDLIAFTKMTGGEFYIGVMKPDGGAERLLTHSYLDEGPTWSPNGRVIIFGRKSQGYGNRGGDSSLYSVDLTGYNEHEVKTPGQASDPAWSPLLTK